MLCLYVWIIKMELQNNRYKTMWILATFDLPTLEKLDRKRYSRFRSLLIKNGFMQLQFSVYAKFFPSFLQGMAVAKNLKSHVPPAGNVMLFYLTDKQFGLTENIINGKMTKEYKENPQLEFF